MGVVMADLASASDAIVTDAELLSTLSDIRFLLALVFAWLTAFAIFGLAKAVYQLVCTNITNYF